MQIKKYRKGVHMSKYRDKDRLSLQPQIKMQNRMHELDIKGQELSFMTRDLGHFLSQTIISQILTGRMIPYVSERRVLAKALKCPQSQLFNLDVYGNPYDDNGSEA